MLRLLVAGSPNREIAGALGIDEATVKAHVGTVDAEGGSGEPDCADGAGGEAEICWVTSE